jgi:hypothetical protein
VQPWCLDLKLSRRRKIYRKIGPHNQVEQIYVAKIF